MKSYLQFLSMLGFFLFLTACGSGEQANSSEEGDSETADNVFGAAFSPETVVPYAELASHMTEADSLAVTVQGKVADVCQSKGCWMNITKGDGEEMMVRFKDYGFFMPKDIAGREVIMNGKAFYRIVPVDELRHYAEDAGKPQEEIDAITEPKQELAFMADGVILLDKQ